MKSNPKQKQTAWLEKQWSHTVKEQIIFSLFFWMNVVQSKALVNFSRGSLEKPPLRYLDPSSSSPSLFIVIVVAVCISFFRCSFVLHYYPIASSLICLFFPHLTLFFLFDRPKLYTYIYYDCRLESLLFSRWFCFLFILYHFGSKWNLTMVFCCKLIYTNLRHIHFSAFRFVSEWKLMETEQGNKMHICTEWTCWNVSASMNHNLQKLEAKNKSI